MSDALLLSRQDVDFLLYEWLDVEALIQVPRFADHQRETFDSVLDLARTIAVEQFMPLYQRADREEPAFDGTIVNIFPEVGTALRVVAEAGLIAAAHDYELGGMQLPTVIDKAASAYLMAANLSFNNYLMLTGANINLLLAHANPALIDAFVKPQLQGRFFGTMCLSEPQAGSSLSDILTRAEYECESALGARYRLKGSKMWISGGDHELTENIVHLVLAKVPGPDGKLLPGTKGISLFAVPKWLVGPDGCRAERNDVALAGLNHKMGNRGTTNCLLNFGEGTRHRPSGKEGAVGYLVGSLNEGLACMFHMMNEARVSVGLGASAVGYTGYLHSLDYARNRSQGRLPTGKNPTSPQVKLIEHADVRRMLLAQKSFVEGALAFNLYCARLIDLQHACTDAAERERLTLLLDILTPIAKSWPSQWCTCANDLAIQIHGGYGYTREYKVEQFYRDNRLNPIHEGTHGIQGLDLLGRKVVMKDGTAFRLLDERVEGTLAKAALAGAQCAEASVALRRQWHRLREVTRALWAAGKADVTLANASLYLEAFGHVVIAWIWLEQLLAVGPSEGDFYDGKRSAARYFFLYELPKVTAQLDLLASLDRTTLDMKDGWF